MVDCFEDRPCCDPTPLGTGPTNPTALPGATEFNCSSSCDFTYLYRFANAFNFLQFSPCVLRAMGSHEYIGLMTALLVISQPESTSGVVYKISSSISGRSGHVGDNSTDVVIAGIVSGMETAYCLYYPNDRLSVAHKVWMTLCAAYQAILEPNLVSSAQLTGSIGTTVFLYVMKNVVSARFCLNEERRGRVSQEFG